MLDWKERCKDADPTDTINKIKSILDKNHFNTKYTEVTSGQNSCFSSRLSIVDSNGHTLNATNGKGMSKNLCMASAYGEMMERIQNTMCNTLINPLDRKIYDFHSISGCVYDMYDSEQLPCIKNIINEIADTTDAPIIFDSKYEYVVELLLSSTPGAKDGKCPAMTMYSLKEKKNVNLPIWILNLICSNGMAAGNTYEEAIVEGISEIFERYSQMKLMDGYIIPPAIPRGEINRFENVKKVIDSIEKDGKYEVRILDCSLGLGLPVACGIIIDKNTGHFSCKCGAHPNMGIALERVFTESTQGVELEKAVEKNYADFYAKVNTERVEKWNILKIGYGRIPAELLMDDPTYPYKTWPDVSNLSNKDMMNMLLGLVDKLGKEVFIRDVAYLGFPAVLIYIPEMSESHCKDIITIKEWKLKFDVLKIFERLDDINDDDINKVMTLANLNSSASLENTINSISGNYYDVLMPGYPFEMIFLYIVTCICLGNYQDAINACTSVKNYYKSIEDKNTINLFEAVYTYANGMNSGTDREQVFEVMRKLFPTLGEKVIDLFADKYKTLSKLYPNCPRHNCEKCNIKECYYKSVHEFHLKLDKLICSNMPDGSELKKILEND